MFIFIFRPWIFKFVFFVFYPCIDGLVLAHKRVLHLYYMVSSIRVRFNVVHTKIDIETSPSKLLLDFPK